MVLIVSEKTPRKSYSLFALAILLLMSGGVALFIGSGHLAIRSFGLVACIASVYLVRISNIHARPALPDSRATELPGRLIWIIGVASLVLLGASFLYLYSDALHGYHEILPVYVFAGAGIACAIVWSYLASRIV